MLGPAVDLLCLGRFGVLEAFKRFVVFGIKRAQHPVPDRKCVTVIIREMRMVLIVKDRACQRKWRAPCR